MKKILRLCILSVLTLCSSMVLAQERTITGKVTFAEDGSTLPGVNVILKGTSIGTTSDASGTYKIAVPDNGTLVFSFIGLATQEVAIGDRSVIDISMAADVTQLSEVVVTAFGMEAEKRSLGTSVATLKSDAIADTRQTNVVNSLTAKIAGVRIMSSSGMVGASSSIFIRGMTSFTASNQPLFVVDGIPIDNSGGGQNLQQGVSNSNRAIDLNPDDIETMTVLKGPAAAVLYGSRAISGAIMITTKKGGSKAKNTISITSNYNISEPNRLPEYQNGYAQGTNGIFNPADPNSWGPKIAGQTVTNWKGEPEVLTAYPNNVKDYFRQGNNIQNSINFKGGNEKSNYIFSYSNLKEDGILINNDLQRNTFKIAANTQLTSKLRAGASVTYFNTMSHRTPIGNQLSNPLFRGWHLPRSYNLANYPFQNANGTQAWWDSGSDQPVWSMLNNTYTDRVDRILASFDLGYDFNDWLGITYKLGTDFYTQNIKANDAVGTIGGAYTAAAGTGGTFDENYYNQQTSSYLNLTAKKTFGDITTNFLVGNEVNQTYNRDQGTTAVGAAVSGFGQVTSYTTYTPFNSQNTVRLIGIYAQAQAGYKDYLFLTLTGRNDWSSTFAKNNNSYFYPSVTTSFIFSDAFPSLKDNSFFNFGKLRGNIATVGRTAPLYAVDTYFGKSNPASGFGPNLQYPFRGVQGYSLSNSAGNQALKPEFTTTMEIGTELRFWNNKLLLDVGYFATKTTDIILAAPSSAASGFTTQVRNAGELQTNGTEITLGITPVKTTNFSWDISANWTMIRNNVIKIDPLVTSIQIGGFVTPGTFLIAGQPYGSLFGNVFNKDASGNLLITASGAAAGQPSINAVKSDVIGNPNPNWTGGITNTLNYKGFQLSFLMDIRSGGDVISRNIRDLRFRGVASETADRDHTYVVQGVLRDPNNNADGTARALLGSDGNPIPNTFALNAQNYWTSLYNTQGEAIVYDASWVRLREMSVTYNLPKALLSKTPFGMAQIVLTGRNLWMYAPNYPHFDPEVSTQGVSNTQGFEYNTMPQTRTYGVLLRLTL